ncbi:MAG: DNA replication and repair protein RecF [Chitinophagales bacterium]
MFLHKLAVLNFKNHPQKALEFSKKINCFIGNNGLGKTNLLDAIYYLCLTKSYFNSSDQQNIMFGKEYFRLDGELTVNQEVFKLVYKVQSGRKKDLTVNEVPLSKLSHHIGNFPAVMIAPDDNQLILGGSDERRRFLDSTISQVNREYLENLILYNKYLAQRNSALKDFAEKRRVDKTLLESYNLKLAELGTKIYEARRVSINLLQPIFKQYYAQLSLERDTVNFRYESQLHEKPLDLLLEEGLDKDLALQRTEWGIHKDDVEFYIASKTNNEDDIKIKKFGSQGQQKSFIISLKFAEYQFIKNATGKKPLLLIDDIFDKLDPDRSRQLIQLISGADFGQVFLTDTDAGHILHEMNERPELIDIARL